MQHSQRSFVGLGEILRRIFCRLFERWCRPKPPHRRLDAFVAGQIHFLTEHDKGLDAETIAKLVQSLPLLRHERVPRPVIVSPQRVISFEFDGRERALSLVFVDLPALRRDRIRLVQLIRELNREINAQNRQEQYDPGRGQDDQSQQGQSTRSGRPTSEQSQRNTLSVRRAAPNWLSGGAPHIGGGGPGARPIPFVSPAASESTGKAPWEFTLPEGLPPGLGGDGIEVAILDTAPDQADLDQAYQDWGATNWLIADLLGPQGTLQVTYGGYSHLVQLADGFLNDHTYPMADHGVFVAGIIRSLAPQAKLHLIEVLNPYGLGTVETIALGLQQLLNRGPDQPRLLVNCSLVINIPPADLLAALAAQDPLWQQFDQQSLQESSETLETICQELRNQNVFLIAAAGNDGDPNADTDNDPNTIAHPLPHFPAAYDSVTGVAALDADDQPAPYSDVCDTPASEGMAVFGGDVDPTAAENADPNHGMLSVFTSVQFPSGALNSNGWARWAGTSFATPTLTGAIAALINPATLPTPDAALQALRNIDVRAPTVVGKIVHIAQG